MEGVLKKRKVEKTCAVDGCTKQPCKRDIKCIKHGGGYRCQVPNCNKGAYDKFKCRKHGGGKPCTAKGCDKRAVKGSTTCRAHGGGLTCNTEGCVNKAITKKIGKCTKHGGGVHCIVNGCNKSAASGSKTCVSHGGGRRCSFQGCDNSARSKQDTCIKHGAKSKTCSIEGCTKQALKGNKCTEHGGRSLCKIDGCTNLSRDLTNRCIKHGGGKRCTVINCNKSANGVSDKCRKHSAPIKCNIESCTNVAMSHFKVCKQHGAKNKKCIVNGCQNVGLGKLCKCGSHGGGIRCPNCIDWPDSRVGKKKYDNYCATCFKRVFPNDPRSTKIRGFTKEIQVRNFINSKFDGFVHDKPIYTTNCNCDHRRRIDHRKLFGNTVLAIETDEFAHKSYDERDEEIRYDDLYMIHSGKWIFIRFNPDGKGVDMEDKLEILYDCMMEQIDRIEHEENEELVEIIKLFY